MKRAYFINLIQFVVCILRGTERMCLKLNKRQTRFNRHA